MLAKLARRLFSETTSSPASEVDHEQQVRLATCVVLLEAACSDDEFTKTEREHILNVMAQRFDLAREDAEGLLEEATAAHNESTDLFRFTARINDAFSPEEKIEIVEEVWRIIYSDGTLDAHEDHLAHKLRNLLNLNHPQLMDAKLKVLAEIRGEPEA